MRLPLSSPSPLPPTLLQRLRRLKRLLPLHCYVYITASPAGSVYHLFQRRFFFQSWELVAFAPSLRMVLAKHSLHSRITVSSEPPKGWEEPQKQGWKIQ